MCVSCCANIGYECTMAIEFANMSCLLQESDSDSDWEWKEEIQYMLHNSDDVNQLMTSVGAALHVAILNRATTCVEALIAKGADVNLPSQTGVRPLCYALQRNGCIDIVSILLEAGADVNCSCPGGETPLMHAVQADSPALLDLLVRHGAHVDRISVSGETALHCAVRCSKERAVDFLLHVGADPDIAARRCGAVLGSYPLTTALSLELHHIVLKLFGAGVNVHVLSDQGSPLAICAYTGWAGTVQNLLRRDVHVNVGSDIRMKSVDLQPVTKYHLEPCSPSCYALLYIAGEQLDYFSSVDFVKDFNDMGWEWFLRRTLMPIDISREPIRSYVRTFVYRGDDDVTARTEQNDRDREKCSQFIKHIHEKNFSLAATSRRAVRGYLLASNPPDSLFTKVKCLVDMYHIPNEVGEYLLYGYHLYQDISFLGEERLPPFDDM